MIFTSEDLLKAIGLKVGDRILVGQNIFAIYIIEKICGSIDLKEENGNGRLSLIELIKYDYEIIQPKPILTEDEKVILKNTPCKEISREMNDDGFEGVRENLWLIKGEIKYDFNLFRHIFKSIKINETYSIEELLKE